MATALELMGVRVEVVGHSQGEMMRPCPTLTYAPVFLNADRPREIALKITVPDSFLSDPNVMVLVVSRGKAGKLEKSHSHFLLRVPVLWDGEVPHTRVKGQDNVDFIFLGRDGSFRDMQVSLSNNKAHFFANIQRVYSGWVVRTRGARIGERRFTFAPSQPEHAYPGCDYGQVFEDMAEELVDWAIDSGSSVQLSRVKPANWVSPDLSALENGKGKKWQRAEVFFWNAVWALAGNWRSATTLSPTKRVHCQSCAQVKESTIGPLLPIPTSQTSSQPSAWSVLPPISSPATQGRDAPG